MVNTQALARTTSATRDGRTPQRRQTGRRLRLAAIGAACVIVAVVAFVAVMASVDERETVWVTTTDINAGHTITAAEVAAVQVAADDTAGLIAAKGTFTAQIAALPLAAGTLLTGHMLADAAAYPPAGRAVVSLALKPGQIPIGTQPGQAVAVYLPGATAPSSSKHDDASSADDGAAATAVSVAGIVTGVETGDTADTVVSMECATADVAKLAAADVAAVMIAHVPTGGQ